MTLTAPETTTNAPTASSFQSPPTTQRKNTSTTASTTRSRTQQQQHTAAEKVTPEDHDKHVRFQHNSNNKNTQAQNQRGLVSRRGGRFVSPGRRVEGTAAAIEQSTNPTTTAGPQNHSFRDEVPSLCSTGSGSLVTKTTFHSSKDKNDPSHETAQSNLPTKSISLERKMAPEETSPLGDEGDDTLILSKPSLEERVMTPPPPSMPKTQNARSHLHPKTPEMTTSLREQPQTSKTSKQLLLSPARGTFLSGPPTPQTTNPNESTPARLARDFAVSTPTDFALDYGKAYTQHHNNANGTIEQQSNVMAWLQSPTANVFFSPTGGYNSLFNTPRASMTQTPRTPTVSTSFFFSDVASLPKAVTEGGGKSLQAHAPNNLHSPKSISRKGNVICISPLNTNKDGNSAMSLSTPMTSAIRDMFGSPGREEEVDHKVSVSSGEKSKSLLKGVPTLSETPSAEDRRVGRKLSIRRSSSENPDVEASMSTSREIMEDEDLSYLLSVSANTPSSVRPPVFRSAVKDGGSGDREDDKSSENNGLHMPEIGKEQYENDTQKPSLEMRKSTSKETDSKAEKKGESKGSRYSVAPQYPPPPGAEAYYGMSVPPGSAGTMHVMVGGPPPGKGGADRNGPYEYMGMYHHQAAMYYPGYPYPYQSHYPPPPPPPHPVYPAHHAPEPDPAAPTTQPSVKRGPGLLVADEKAAKKRKIATPPSGKKRRAPSPDHESFSQEKSGKPNSASVSDKKTDGDSGALRGVTMRPSGKWQAQLYFAGKSRYIGVFDSREKAALAYEIARDKLKSGAKTTNTSNPKETEDLVNEARKAAFDGVNEQLK